MVIRYARSACLFGVATDEHSARTYVSLGSGDGAKTFRSRKSIHAYEMVVCCETRDWITVTVTVAVLRAAEKHQRTRASNRDEET